MPKRIFTPTYKLSIGDCKRPERLIGACREVINDPGQFYELKRYEGQPTGAYLIAWDEFQAFVDELDPALSKPVLMNTIQLPVTAAAIRFEEVYNLAVGLSEFPGNEPGSWPGTIFKSGFELKIKTEGTHSDIVVETLEASGGSVEVSHPVSTTADVTAEYSGGALQVSGSGGQSGELVLQDLTYTAVGAGAFTNNITIGYLPMVPAVKSQLMFQGVHLQAAVAGVAGDAITMETTPGATFGAEVVSVAGSAISVQIAEGQTNAAIIAALINNDQDAQALVLATPTGPGAIELAQGATNLAGGADAIGVAGAEVVAVSGVNITVTMESGVSTADDIEAAVSGDADATALVTVAVSGTGTNVQVSQSPLHLENGEDAEAANQLGVVELLDNGSPVADGTEVSVAYPSINYTVYQIQVGRQNAAIMSVDLLGYLSENSLP